MADTPTAVQGERTSPRAAAPSRPLATHAGPLPESVLRPVFLTALVAVSLWLVVTLLTEPFRLLPIYQAVVVVLIVICLLMAQRGRNREAAVLFALSTWALIQLPPFVTGHLVIPGIMLPVVSILAVGLLWSMRAAMVLTPVTSLIWLGALGAKNQGWLNAPEPRTDIQFWFILTVCLFLVVTFLHVTTKALRDALAQTRSSAEQANRLMQEAPDPILIVDAQGTILAANAAAELTTGLPVSRIVGHGLFASSFLSDADADAARAAAVTALGGESPAPFEVHWIRLDGREMTVEARCHRIEWDGQSCLQVILRDITLRRRAERERRVQSEEVNQKQKIEAVGQLAGGIAHEFNNLMTVVSGCAGLIREDPDATAPIIELAGEIDLAQSQAATLTRRLLAFGQRQVVEPSRMSVAAETALFERSLRTVVGEGAQLHLSLSSLDTNVVFDPHQLEQILVNLVANARDAIEGAGVCRVCVDPVTLDSPLAGATDIVPAGDYVLLSVSDDGHGIPEDVLPRIFEPFYSTHRTGEGSGLGLSAVLGIVRQARGQVTVSSSPEEGARFAVYLPHVSGGSAI